MSTANITSPEIETLQARLKELDIRESAYRATEKDNVVAVASEFDPVTAGHQRVAHSRKGFVYEFDYALNDWVPSATIPPVPGTPARSFWDVRRRIENRIAKRQAGLEDIPDEVADLIDAED